MRIFKYKSLISKGRRKIERRINIVMLKEWERISKWKQVREKENQGNSDKIIMVYQFIVACSKAY